MYRGLARADLCERMLAMNKATKRRDEEQRVRQDSASPEAQGITTPCALALVCEHGTQPGRVLQLKRAAREIHVRAQNARCSAWPASEAQAAEGNRSGAYGRPARTVEA